MNTKDLALDLEITIVLSERSGLELAPSDFDLPSFQLGHKLAECGLANFVDFRGISNPKRFAVGQATSLLQAFYAYLEDPPYHDSTSNVDDPASTNSISKSYLEEH
jgi:hypothetical protein